MKPEIFIYIGASLPFLWGIAHLFPTRSVVSGFGGITADNRNIITMEWIIEGVALIFIGFLVAVTTVIDPHTAVSSFVYLSSSACLIVLAGVSLFTGFKINFLPFKLCPVIFTSASVLILAGWKLL